MTHRTTTPISRRRLVAAAAALPAAALALPLALPRAVRAAAPAPARIALDWAYYNPLSLALRRFGWLEKEFAADKTEIRWVQSHGSNKALEFLNAGALDLGSTAGAAALLGRLNGNPIRSVYLYSKPEWTALVTRPGSGVARVADLKGRRVAVTRGTDPYIFLVRALAGAGLAERDIRPVLVQHADGRAALERGDVDAWAGLDPMMAETEIERGSVLFHRNADFNTYGVLNARAAFAAEHPAALVRVLAVYERARRWALAHPAELRAILAEAAKLKDAVAARQLERTEFVAGTPGDAARATILAAGLALQEGGVVEAKADVKGAVAALIEPRFAAEAVRLEGAAK
jgi:sulfonate transport system substrate-binding protein